MRACGQEAEQAHAEQAAEIEAAAGAADEEWRGLAAARAALESAGAMLARARDALAAARPAAEAEVAGAEVAGAVTPPRPLLTRCGTGLGGMVEGVH